jgi:hypothetical protein
MIDLLKLYVDLFLHLIVEEIKFTVTIYLLALGIMPVALDLADVAMFYTGS